MTSTKLIIAALMVPLVTLTALVMAAAAVAHGLLSRRLANNVLLGTGRHSEVINSVAVGGSAWARPATSKEYAR
jgi:uncharacterized membrane protein